MLLCVLHGLVAWLSVGDALEPELFDALAELLRGDSVHPCYGGEPLAVGAERVDFAFEREGLNFWRRRRRWGALLYYFYSSIFFLFLYFPLFLLQKLRDLAGFCCKNPIIAAEMQEVRVFGGCGLDSPYGEVTSLNACRCQYLYRIKQRLVEQSPSDQAVDNLREQFGAHTRQFAKQLGA